MLQRNKMIVQSENMYSKYLKKETLLYSIKYIKKAIICLNKILYLYICGNIVIFR